MKIIDKFQDKIKGILSGYDRMIIKGYLRQFFSTSGKMYFLSQENVLLKDFGEYAKRITGENLRDTILNYLKFSIMSLELNTIPQVKTDL